MSGKYVKNIKQPCGKAAEIPGSLVSIRGLEVRFPAGNEFSRVVTCLDFDIAPGETVGIVGESGCGKSVTWLAAMGLLGSRSKVSGSVRLKGREILGADDDALSRIRGGQIGMIFQDASSSLNPVQTIGRQISEALAIHRRLSGRQIGEAARTLLNDVGIGDPERRLKQYPHEISGGMNQRVMIAMALAGEPDLLIADEPTTALDATIQAQILDLLRDVQARTGMALVFISHDLGVVSDICGRINVMYAGCIVETAARDSLFENPLHPYTQGLLAAVPELEGPRRRLTTIPGVVPALGARLNGCRFSPRCPIGEKACEQRLPELREIEEGHCAACLHAGTDAWAGREERS